MRGGREEKGVSGREESVEWDWRRECEMELGREIGEWNGIGEGD